MSGSINRLQHWWQHFRGTNTGSVVTWAENGLIHVGFECSVCKKIDQKTVETINESELLNGKYRNLDSSLDIGSDDHL